MKQSAVLGLASILGSSRSFADLPNPSTTPTSRDEGDGVDDTSLPAREVDVVVIGAGFAGISAAERLHQSGLRVQVIEARSRMGGRTWTQAYGPDGKSYDSGGQWIGPGQDFVYRLVQHHGVATFKTYDQGQTLLETGRRGDAGVFQSYAAENGLTSGVALRIFKGTALDFSSLYAGLDRLAETVDLQAPWLTPNAEVLDGMTLESWINSQWAKLGPISFRPADEKIRRLMRSVIHMIFAADPGKISLLHALFYIKAGGGMDSLINVGGGAQEERFLNGTKDLLDRIAAPISDHVILGSPVFRIEQTGDQVVVHSRRVKVTASRVIVAIPPTLIPRIEFFPRLSPQRELLLQSVPMGNVIKVMAFYDRPFWRFNNRWGQGGLSGQAFSSFTSLTGLFDNSHPDSPYGTLLGFFVGPNADQALFQSHEARRSEALQSFAHFFGSEALRPLHYEEKIWAGEEYSHGGYAGYLPTGVWTSLGSSLRQPEGRIHWAGTETASEWNGYIEGAVRSGYRAAREILES